MVGIESEISGNVVRIWTLAVVVVPVVVLEPVLVELPVGVFVTGDGAGAGIIPLEVDVPARFAGEVFSGVEVPTGFTGRLTSSCPNVSSNVSASSFAHFLQSDCSGDSGSALSAIE